MASIILPSGTLLTGSGSTLDDGTGTLTTQNNLISNSGVVAGNGTLSLRGGIGDGLSATVDNNSNIVANNDGLGTNLGTITSTGYLQVEGGSHLYSGTGAPTFAAVVGDLYLRLDGGGTAGQNIYTCTVATGTWVGIA
ncbi:MAG TPA: hypothetical protein VMW47_13200 [Verrucomicrobiae bacterium]|nr:hypothetical protein [Verrucomicrobiae bacterium]